MSPWIGVDLDGTLAHYQREYVERMLIGPPIPVMLMRVKLWIAKGKTVKIFTARAHDPAQVELIKRWCEKHGLPGLEITATKDFGMVELWDDRCVQVQSNSGIVMSADPSKAATSYVPG